jgi:hypothetical protein
MTVHNIAPQKSAMIPAPMLTRVVSNPIFSDLEEAITWAVGQPHPLVPDAYKVIRMFIDLGGVEIYSMSLDGKNGMRNIIPTSKIRFTEEAMPLGVFGEELYAAEAEGAPVGPLSAGDGDDDDDGDDEPEPDLDEPEAASSNGPAPITS